MDRAAHVHEAIVVLDPSTDEGAPGAAVTVALCGSWQHEGLCRWPHYTGVVGDGPRRRLRTLLVAPEDELASVLDRVTAALASGALPGAPSRRWTLVSQGPAEPTPDEHAHLARLAGTGPTPDAQPPG